jgi:mycothiol synthase
MTDNVPYSIRNYKSGDFEDLLNLINHCSHSDEEPFRMTAAQLMDKLSAPDTIPGKDYFIVGTSAQQVVGYGEGFLRKSVGAQLYMTRASILPEFRHQRIGKALLSQLWERVVELTTQYQITTILSARVTAENLYARLLFEQFNMQMERTLVEMVRNLSIGIPQLQIPTGIKLISWRDFGDISSVLEARNQAFRDHWNFLPETLERYQHNLTSGKFSLEHSMIALENDLVVGGVICQTGESINSLRGENQAYLINLFVDQAARKRGVGTALLVSAMQAAKDIGHASIALKVDSENQTGAIQVYTKAGFRDKIHWMVYQRVCGHTPPLISDST